MENTFLAYPDKNASAYTKERYCMYWSVPTTYVIRVTDYPAKNNIVYMEKKKQKRTILLFYKRYRFELFMHHIF